VPAITPVEARKKCWSESGGALCTRKLYFTVVFKLCSPELLVGFVGVDERPLFVAMQINIYHKILILYRLV
jgi:hypothetical protein